MTVQNNPRIYYWLTILGAINFVNPIITLYYLHRGLEYADLFIFLTIIVIAMFLFEVPTGIFADHFGYRASFLAGQLLFVITQILLLFSHSTLLFYLAQFLMGVGITFYSGSQEAFIHDSLKQQGKLNQLSKWMGNINAAFMLSGIFAAILGSIIGKDLTESQFVLLFSLTIFFHIIRFFGTFLLTNPLKYSEHLSPFNHIKNGWKIIKTTPALLLIFLNETLVMIPLHIFDHVIKQPFFLDIGLPVFFIGTVFALRALSQFLLSHNLEWFEKHFTIKSIIITTNILILLSYLAGALIDNTLITGLLLFFILTAANSLRLPFFVTLKNEYIPDGSRATTLSLLSMIDSAFDVIIFLSLAAVADLGIPIIFLGSAIVVFIGVLLPIKQKQP